MPNALMPFVLSVLEFAWKAVAAVAAVAYLTRGIWLQWLERFFDSRLRLDTEGRLKEMQLRLDKEFERHRRVLEADADRHRSRLSREAIDYGLWAARRHEATERLFAELLRQEHVATSFSDLASPDLEHWSTESLDELMRRLEASPSLLDSVVRHHAAGRHEIAENELEKWLARKRTDRVIAARNAAHEAYYASALYLSEHVNATAISVRDYFHEMIVEHRVPRDGAPNVVRLRLALREKMIDLLNAARADLGRSAISVAAREA